MILGLTKRLILIDAETCSAVDLPKCGADAYFASRSTRCLMVGFREHGAPGPVHLYEPRLGPPPKLLVEAAAAPPDEVVLCAYNAGFDRAALRLAGIDTPIEKWVDIMLLSYILGFAGGLDNVLTQFGIKGPDGKPAKKNPEGKRLIRQFSVARTPWFDDPGSWARFCGYCRQDVDVEDNLLTQCLRVLDTPGFTPMVQKLQGQWLRDQKMNAAGMPVSMATVDGALKIKAQETRRLTARLKALTGLANPSSVQQLMGWLSEQGAPLDNLQAPTVREALAGREVPLAVGEVLQSRLEIGKASVKKYDAIKRMQVGGWVRNGYTTCGASRTGRTAMRGLNLGNLERPKIKGPQADLAADLLEFGDPDLLTMWMHGKAADLSIMELLGSCIRGAIAAPPGKAICAVDLKSIESVGLAWLAGCDQILDLFWEGKDTYKDFATRYYNTPYDMVTGDQRTFCKPAVLGCGYSASGPALVAYAAGMSVTLDEETANGMVETFRSGYPEIPLLWANLEAAAKRAILQPGTEHRAYACDEVGRSGMRHGERPQATYKAWPYVSYYSDGEFLYCGLPSGRTLFYHQPKIESLRRTSKRTGNDYWSQNITYMGKRQESGGAWFRISTHGGMLAENVTQAICRDILYHGLELAHQDPLIEIVGSTYDEIISLSDEQESEAAYHRMVGYMTTPPPWVDDRFYLGADGYFGAKRYRK